MFGNGKLFVSHTHEDNQRSQPLLTALDAWQLDYWFDLQELSAGQRFSDQIQHELGERDILLRICTPAARQSFWMNRELRAVHGLQRAFPQHPRLIVHLVLSRDYTPDTAEAREISIDATRGTRSEWLHQLHLALGFTPERRVNRRTAIALGATSLAAVVATGIAGTLYLHGATTTPPSFHPTGAATTNVVPGAERLRWKYYPSLATPNGLGFLANHASIVTDGAALYIIEDLDDIVALAPKDGTTVWVANRQSPFGLLGSSSALAVNDVALYNLAYTRDAQRNPQLRLVAYDKGKGISIGQTSSLGPGQSGVFYPSAFAVAGTTLYFVEEGRLRAFDALKERWSTSALFDSSKDLTFTTSAPVAAGNSVYVGTNDGRLFAFDALTGAMRWVLPITTQQSYPLLTPPAVADGVVYIGASDGACYAFDAATGSRLWKTSLITKASTFTKLSTPVIANGAVYLQGNFDNYTASHISGQLFALDAKSGTVRWQVDPLKLPLGLEIAQPYVVANIAPGYVQGQTVYFTFSVVPNASDFSKSPNEVSTQVLVALSTTNGSLQWFYPVSIGGGSIINSNSYPSSPIPIPGSPGGLAFMTNQPSLYVFNID